MPRRYNEFYKSWRKVECHKCGKVIGVYITDDQASAIRKDGIFNFRCCGTQQAELV